MSKPREDVALLETDQKSERLTIEDLAEYQREKWAPEPSPLPPATDAGARETGTKFSAVLRTFRRRMKRKAPTIRAIL
jgi:hypothetical protein